MHHFLVPFCLFLAALTATGEAAPRRVELVPPGSEISMRAYGLGLLAFDGQFTRFHGWLTYDPADHAVCKVELTVEVASLVMSDMSMRDTVVGPDFMDGTNHPLMVYAGACRSLAVEGMLTLRGVTRSFGLSLTWSPDHVIAVGELRRADWGMTAMPILAGPTIRIRVAVPLSDPAHASLEQ